MSFEQIGSNKSFDGQQLRYRHRSDVLNCDMTFSIYLPPAAESTRVPVLYWLSGLTCTDENFVTKAGVQRYASELGVAVVAPDTSPRGEGVPDDPEGDWDFGLGAGFYVNATQEPWNEHYRMYDYIVDELPAWVEADDAASDVRAISGHSMGGHGALTIALKNPGRYRSVSAFSPIVAPTQVPWGEKAFSAYLGDDREAWKQYDTVELVKQGAAEQLPLLIDQGGDDEFLEGQLKPELLRAAAEAAGHPLELRMQPGYDHSYYFISSFIGDHIAHHAAALRG